MPENLLILFTLALLIYSIWRVGMVPFPTGLIFILGASQVLFALAHQNLVYYQMLKVMNYGGLRQQYANTQIVYSTMALLSLMMLAGKMKSIKALRIDREKLVSLSTNSIVGRSASIVVCLVALHICLFLLITDWGKLWLNYAYLGDLADGEMAALFGYFIPHTILGTTTLWAVVAVLCVGLLAESASTSLKLTAAVSSLFYFLILASLDSRSAAIVPGLVAIYYGVLDLKGRRVIVPAMILIAVMSFTSALYGRGTVEHGLAKIPDHFLLHFFDASAPLTAAEPVDFGLEFCQGIFTTAESLQIRGVFPIRYQLLAFSPLPSFLDGYSKIQEQSAHRLHVFVPMSGLGEAINFGWPYVCLLIFVLALIVRIHAGLSEKSPLVFLVANFLILSSCYVLLTYPVRNGLRYAWIGFFVSVFSLVRNKIASFKAPFAR